MQFIVCQLHFKKELRLTNKDKMTCQVSANGSKVKTQIPVAILPIYTLLLLHLVDSRRKCLLTRIEK